MDNRVAIFAVSMFLISGMASAGTVTLTGSCSSHLMQGNVINFTLKNSGNDTAHNLQLTPIIHGAQPVNSLYSINSLPPDLLTPVNVILGNVTGRGTFVDSFVLFYQQGASTFSALFPCVIDIGPSAQSELYITANTAEKGGIATINVSVTNGGNKNIQANVSALFPPEFTFASPSSYLVNMGPFATKEFGFAVNYPSLQGSFTGVAIAQYELNGTSYAAYSNLLVTSAAQSAKSRLDYALYAIIVVIIAIVLLIARSALRNRKPGEKQINTLS